MILKLISANNQKIVQFIENSMLSVLLKKKSLKKLKKYWMKRQKNYKLFI